MPCPLKWKKAMSPGWLACTMPCRYRLMLAPVGDSLLLPSSTSTEMLCGLKP